MSDTDKAVTEQADRLLTLRQSRQLMGTTAVISAATGMTAKQAQEVLHMIVGVAERAQLSEAVLQTLPHISKRRTRQIHAMTEWALLLFIECLI